MALDSLAFLSCYVPLMRPWIPALAALAACSDYKFTSEADAAGDTAAASPAIIVDPLAVDYGALSAAAPPVTEVVTVWNNGEADLWIYDVTLADPGGPYSLTAVESDLVAPGEYTHFTVTYDPASGPSPGQAIVESNDPDDPTVPVGLRASTDGAAPDIEVSPALHDFGLLTVGEADRVEITVQNRGDADLTVSSLDFFPDSADLTLDQGGAPPLPWSLAPGASRALWVDYAPADDGADSARLVVTSDDPDTPEAEALQVGAARSFEGFTTGWYVLDDGVAYETTSNPHYVVDHHGDTDLYWYEPSGAHGLWGSADPAADFALMADYVRDRVGEPTPVTGPFSFSESSSLATFAWATYTYFLCDFYLEPDDDPARYEITSGEVDDGIQVMVNGEILGHLRLGDAGGAWPLANALPGQVNTLIIILVDDSEVLKYVNDLAFYRDGVMLTDP